MSCITENTVVCRPDAVGRVMTDLENYDSSYDYKEVFRNDKLVIIIFDCNGDSPWDIMPSSEQKTEDDDILAIETNYGDGDGYWTRIWTDKYGLAGYDGELLDWLHDVLTEQEYNEVKPLIAYTI